jgi:hypothetical protein
MKTSCIGLLVLSVSGWGAAAYAQPKDECLDAAVHGLGLRGRKQWREAREGFRACSNAACPAGTRKDCAAWLQQIEAGIPRVVLSATDAGGRDVIDVRVTLDGALLSTRLDGISVEVDPGTHLLRFEFADGSVVQQEVTFTEGYKRHRVSVLQPAPAAPLASVPSPASPAPAASVSPAPSPAVPVAATAAIPEPPDNRQRTLGLALGGVGGAGLVAGAVLGMVASSKWSSARNDCTPNACGAGSTAQGERSDALTLATWSTVGFIAGGVMLATGAALFFTAPHPRESGRLRVAPAVGSASGGVVVTGVFE